MFPVAERLENGPNIKAFTFSRDGKQLVVNASDKTLRLFNISDRKLVHVLSDVVEMVQWKACHFVGDDYVIGGR